ncbi:MAG: CCA tRNA nucleotidyltransferase [Ruminococcus sp.]
MNVKLPQNVNKIISMMESSGFECYVVGGCVRDMLMGITPKDYDLTTNAKPDEMLRIFSDYKTFDNGIKHGTVSVIMDGEVYEITTYRIDGDYIDCRHPENVEFTSSLKEDLSRRDFTVNAMAYNPQEGLVDYFNGKRDVEYKAIRCVGDADLRFKEDALRILRALRFASVYNFSIEYNTFNAILENKKLLNNISKERIANEFTQILCGQCCDYILRRFKDVVAVVIPEIASMFNFQQNNPYHNKTLWKHTVSSVKNIESDGVLRMTMLLHDIGKPMSQKTDKNGNSVYHGHERIGEAISREVLTRLKYPKNFIDTVSFLIRNHSLNINTDKVIIKKILKNMGEDKFRLLLKVQKADILAQSNYKREEKLQNLSNVQVLFDEIIDKSECYSLQTLNVNGSDLIHSGITEGKIIGETLNRLLNLVIEEKCSNIKEELLKNI